NVMGETCTMETDRFPPLPALFCCLHPTSFAKCYPACLYEPRCRPHGYTLILMCSPLSHLIMNSFSWPGVNPVRTGSHGPRAPIPPSSAFVIRIKHSFGTVLIAWWST